jgi:hypothetical protein
MLFRNNTPRENRTPVMVGRPVYHHTVNKNSTIDVPSTVGLIFFCVEVSLPRVSVAFNRSHHVGNDNKSKSSHCC